MALRFLSSCMSRYRLVDQRVLGKCLSLAAAQLMAELLSGKAPTTKRGLVTFVINPDRVGFAHAFADATKTDHPAKPFPSLHDARAWLLDQMRR